MRATAVYGINIEDLIPARKRLMEAHLVNGSWHKVAKALKLNVRYVYDFALRGKLPRNRSIQRKLLGRRSINQHLAEDSIQDMPTPLLAWALENREEI